MKNTKKRAKCAFFMSFQYSEGVSSTERGIVRTKICSVKQQGGGAEQHKQPACHGPGYAVAKLPHGGGAQKKRGRLRCGRAGRRSRRFGICGAAGGAALPHTAVFGGSKSVICAPGHLRREGMAALAAKACLTDIFRRTKRACFHKLYYLSGYRIAFGFGAAAKK